MAILQLKVWSVNKQMRGLTLIEVLIALAIVSIAITAVIKATSQNIRATNHLQNKTVASWIAKSALNGVLLNASPQDTELNTRIALFVLNKEWQVVIDKKETPNPHIMKVLVKVYDQDPDMHNDLPALAQLESYLYENNKM